MQCPTCSKDFTRIASHWSTGTCDYPEFSDRQHEIITGLLMGDGSIHRQEGRSPNLHVPMSTKPFLEWIDTEMGIFSKGVDLDVNAEDNARKKRESGFSPNAKTENYSDMYRLYTMRHPGLQQYADWYESGKKVWPSDISLTPLTLKVYYCCDGSLDKHGRIIFSMHNERDRKEIIEEIFDEVSGTWNDGDRHCNYYCSVSESERIFEYMGEPLDGFEHKWP